MRWNRIGVVACMVMMAGACGGGEDSSNNNGAAGTGVAGTAAPGQVTGGMTATAGAGAGTGAAGMGTAGGAGFSFMCPEDPGITNCGSESCSPVSGTLAMACVQTCCTADMRCGTRNAALGSDCTPPYVNDTMCPNETIGGTMVQGCCVEGTNRCGIFDTLTGMGCLARDDFRLRIFASLEPLNCDGTPVMTDAGAGGAMGAAGMGAGAGGGMAGAGAGGMGGAGMGAGMGTAGTNP